MSGAYPQIKDLGLTGKLVTFSSSLSEPANRAALAFRAEVAAQRWEGVQEVASSLASCLVRYDPLALRPELLESRLADLVSTRNWLDAQLPGGRKEWRIPVVLGGAHGPQFDEAASLAGLSAAEARNDIANARLRVFALGFAPGQPYMGQLGQHWDIPRMSTLNPQVPAGALVVAVRQLIVFAGPAPTGWRHIGQTRFRCFEPAGSNPIALTPGDEVCFRIIDADELDSADISQKVLG